MKSLWKLSSLALCIGLSACASSSKKAVSHIVTKEQQAALTPDIVIQRLKAGNQRFREGKLTKRNYGAAVRQAAEGQYPKAFVLSCIDSRVPVESVFDQTVGSLFVGRVAGNFVNTDLLGSMEYACKVAGAKVIVVLGHQHCGALKGAIDDVKMGNITPMLANLKPAVRTTVYQGKRSSKNEDFVRHVCENNVALAIRQIRERSPILREMERRGQIKIVGAYLNFVHNEMKFLD